MKKSTAQRCFFIFLSLITVLFVTTYEPVIYGNDEASIERYIMKKAGLSLEDHIELLAVEDYGNDRIAVFRRETKIPDDVRIVRFRKNEDGNYEVYTPIKSMHQRYDGSTIWTYFLRGRDDDQEVIYAAWSENPKLASIHIRLYNQEEQILPVTENPSLTLLKFEAVNNYISSRDTYHDAQGNEVN